jgi:FrmR/RcnR family transcriptional regulator, repressor of frmRAB operon
MAHTVADKKNLIARVRRIKGQIEALEKALEAEKDCSAILHQIAGCRGAMNGLMAEVVEGHIRSHLVPGSGTKQSKAAEDLIALVNSYLK